MVKVGDILYLTSQLSCDLQTGLIVPGDIAAQTRKALENIKYLLSNAGIDLLISSMLVKAAGPFDRDVPH